MDGFWLLLLLIYVLICLKSAGIIKPIFPKLNKKNMYEYKGNYYRVTGKGKVKIGAEWVDCIIYMLMDGHETFVREKSDFINKFKKVTI